MWFLCFKRAVWFPGVLLLGGFWFCGSGVSWFISVQAEIQKYLQPSNPRFKNYAVPCNSSRNKVKAITFRPEQLFIPQHWFLKQFICSHVRIYHCQCRCSDKCIKIMHSLERLSFAQLPGITPQYLWGGTTWAWFRITALLAHSLSVTLHHSFRKMFYSPHPAFTSQVWLNYVLKDVLWQTASPGEVHFVHGWKWAAMWTAVKWLVFLLLSNHSVCPHVGTHSRQGNVDFMEAAKVCFYLKWSAHFLTESELTVKTIGWHLFSITVDRYFFVMPPHTCALSGVSPPAVFLLCSSRRGMDCDRQFSAPLWINLNGFNVSPLSTIHSPQCCVDMCCHGQLTRFIIDHGHVELK